LINISFHFIIPYCGEPQFIVGILFMEKTKITPTTIYNKFNYSVSEKMLINFTLLFRLLFLSLFKSKNTHYRLSGKRIRFLIFFFVLFSYGLISAWFCFLLDNILFRRFRKQKIKTPLFIIGNFRSGTTFLHRLLAKDHKNFTCLKTWEIYIAPSVSQRKLFRGVLIVDKWVGGFITRTLHRFEQNVLDTIQLHRVGLCEPEEDEGILLYIWNSMFIWFMFPLLENMDRYFYFDKKMPAAQKKVIMKFYKRCLQRHIYAHGGDKVFLSKNPCFTPKIDTLLKYFPDAKIIYLARNPLGMFPSKMSWFSFCWNYFNNLKEPFPFKQEVIRMTKEWYLYPLERLKREPESRYQIIKYNDVITKPEQTVRNIYEKFGFKMSNEFERLLKHEAEKVKMFKKSRISSLSQLELSKKQIVEAYSEVYNHFGFDITKE
jgi:hypothetical protein